MNRSLLFALCFIWLFVITYIVNSFVLWDDTAGLVVNSSLNIFTADSSASDLENTVGLFRTFLGVMSFSISGLPFIFNLFFYVPTAIIGFQAMQFLRGN